MTLARDLRALRERVPYGLADLLHLARTPVGRQQLVAAVAWFAWYPLAPLAALWRRTVLRRVPVVGVTGSFGKTTTTRAVARALDLPLPPAANFRGYLATALLRRGPGAAAVVCEVGISRAGQMRQYGRMLRPRVAVVTAVGAEHATSLGGLDEIAREKGDLVAALAPGGVAVLAGDDSRVREMAARTRERVVTFGFGAACDYRAVALALDWPRGSRMAVEGPGFRVDVAVPFVARHQAESALAALAVAAELGVPAPVAAARLATLPPTPSRLELVPLPSGAHVLRDEYKCTADTVGAAFEVLAGLPAGRRFAVLGDMAEAPRPLHRSYLALGDRAGRAVDRLICVGENYRWVAKGARRAGLRPEAISTTRDLAEAAELLARELASGDVVLLKGRSLEKLDRVALRLLGRRVACQLPRCRCRSLRCDDCAMLERGWRGLRPVT
jgi:UDP-N-acetylmuramoyl-tripeptide--D-alanyl-D-alanine ligase